MRCRKSGGGGGFMGERDQQELAKYNLVIRQKCTGIGNMYLEVAIKKWCEIGMKENKGNY